MYRKLTTALILLSLMLGLGLTFHTILHATVNEDTSANRYVATGSLTAFTYTFKVFSKRDLEVLVDSTTKTVDLDYLVSGVGSATGGTVTFLVAPANGTTVTLLRKQPPSQLSTYFPNEPFPSTRIERDLDRVTMQTQQLKEQMGRALLFGKSATITGQYVDAPVVGSFARAKVGGGIDWATVVSGGGITIPVALNQGGTGSTTAATARTALGVPTLAEAGVQLDNVFRITGSGDASKRLAFEVDGFTTGLTRSVTPQDKDGTLAYTSEFTYSTLAGAPGRLPFPLKWIAGLTYSNNAGDATNDLDIAAGECRDATNTHNILLATLTKQSDVVWAVGTNQGMLDTGAVGNSDYYLWAIKRSDTGVSDVLASLSSTAPTMPANYDVKRLIGWFKRVGGAVVAFTTYETEGGGLELLWSVPTLDINLANTLTTSRRTDAVKVPLNFSTIAHLNVVISDASATADVWIACPDQADAASSRTAAPLSNITVGTASATSLGVQQMHVRTSAAGLIAARANLATVDLYAVSTMGFIWARRN